MHRSESRLLDPQAKELDVALDYYLRTAPVVSGCHITQRAQPVIRKSEWFRNRPRKAVPLRLSDQQRRIRLRAAKLAWRVFL